MAARRDNFTSNSRQYHPYRSQDKPAYNSSYDSRNRQYSGDRHSPDIKKLFDTPSSNAGFSSNERQYPPQDAYSRPRNESFSKNDRGFCHDTYSQSRNNERGYPQDTYSQPWNNERGYPEETYSQPRNNERGYPEDTYSQPHNSERGYPQEAHSQPPNQSFSRPSYNRGGMNTSMSGSSYQGNNQSYNRNDNHSKPQSSRGYTTNLQHSDPSQGFLDNPGGSEELGHLSENQNDSDGSDDDNNPSVGGMDLNKKEDLLKYIDSLLFAKQRQLLKAIDKYNEMVRKFDSLGRVFEDPDDKRMYLHWRRCINKLCGFIKKDMTLIPPNMFRLDQILIDKNQMPGLSEPGQSDNMRGLPNLNINPNAKKGLKVHMQQRMFAKEKIDFESIALEKLRGDPDKKLELFGDLAKVYWESKRNQKNDRNKKFEARKALKKIRKKLKDLGLQLKK